VNPSGRNMTALAIQKCFCNFFCQFWCETTGIILAVAPTSFNNRISIHISERIQYYLGGPVDSQALWWQYFQRPRHFCKYGAIPAIDLLFATRHCLANLFGFLLRGLKAGPFVANHLPDVWSRISQLVYWVPFTIVVRFLMLTVIPLSVTEFEFFIRSERTEFSFRYAEENAQKRHKTDVAAPAP